MTERIIAQNLGDWNISFIGRYLLDVLYWQSETGKQLAAEGWLT
jgi:hypothetical protein